MDRETLDDDPTLPLPGHRSGAGSRSILPFLLKSLAGKPAAPAPAAAATAPSPAPAAPRDADGSATGRGA